MYCCTDLGQWNSIRLEKTRKFRFLECIVIEVINTDKVSTGSSPEFDIQCRLFRIVFCECSEPFVSKMRLRSELVKETSITVRRTSNALDHLSLRMPIDQ